ncbi:hypothetical protein AB0B57_34815 [Micromonospora sp. NPDC049101]|uniref:hypothetical protein n=1 Tax=Micromonospora sp. NPDC049101 TaxID=3155032 RepID=UPI00340423B2
MRSAGGSAPGRTRWTTSSRPSGHVLATGRPGLLLLVDDTGRPRERRLVDQQISGLRVSTPGVLLVAGKGSLLAVDAAMPSA